MQYFVPAHVLNFMYADHRWEKKCWYPPFPPNPRPMLTAARLSEENIETTDLLSTHRCANGDELARQNCAWQYLDLSQPEANLSGQKLVETRRPDGKMNGTWKGMGKVYCNF